MKKDIKNNKYKDQIEDLLESYFANITNKLPEEDIGVYIDDEDAELLEALNYGLSNLEEALSEDEFKQLKPGDFILVKQFQNDYDPITAKHLIRPCLITHIIDDRAYGFTTTTQKVDQRYSLEYLLISDYQDCGLKESCYLDLELCNFYKRQLIKSVGDDKICLGHVTEDLKNKLFLRMQQIVSTKNWLDNITYYPNKILTDINEM